MVVYLFASFEGFVATSGVNPYSYSDICTARGRGEGDRQNLMIDKIKEMQRSLKETKKTGDVLQGDALADAPRDTSSDEN